MPQKTGNQKQVASCLQVYKDGAVFLRSFDTQQVQYYLDNYGREMMVLSPNAPTLNVARMAYSNSVVVAVIQKHLLELARACGVTTTPAAADAISEDIISGYGDLKITEIILALKMIREGKFRKGENGDRNRGEFFGSLSSAVICDCINRFKAEYRNRIIDQHMSDETRRRNSDMFANASSYDDRFLSIFRAVMTCHPDDINSSISTAKIFLNKQDMEILEFFASERKALTRLYERNQEFLLAVEAYNASHPDAPMPELPELSNIRKGVKYITDKFPFDVTEAMESVLNKR